MFSTQQWLSTWRMVFSPYRSQILRRRTSMPVPGCCKLKEESVKKIQKPKIRIPKIYEPQRFPKWFKLHMDVNTNIILSNVRNIQHLSVLRICDLSCKNVPYSIHSNSWTHGKWTDKKQVQVMNGWGRTAEGLHKFLNGWGVSGWQKLFFYCITHNYLHKFHYDTLLIHYT